MNVNLHIERLILEGLSLGPGEHLVVRAAAERELSRLLSAGPPPPGLTSGGAVARISAGELKLTPDGGPRQLGRQIAQAVYKGVGR